MTPKERKTFLFYLYTDADRVSQTALAIAYDAQYLSARMRRNSGMFDIEKAAHDVTLLRKKLAEVEANLDSAYRRIEGK